MGGWGAWVWVACPCAIPKLRDPSKLTKFKDSFMLNANCLLAFKFLGAIAARPENNFKKTVMSLSPPPPTKNCKLTQHEMGPVSFYA